MILRIKLRTFRMTLQIKMKNIFKFLLLPMQWKDIEEKPVGVFRNICLSLTCRGVDSADSAVKPTMSEK